MTRRSFLPSVAFLLATLTSCSSGVHFSRKPAAEPHFSSRVHQPSPSAFFYEPAGLADDYPQESFGGKKLKRDFETLRATGSKYYRIGISWTETEVAPGRYDWSRWDKVVDMAEKYGITIIPYVCYTPQWANGEGDQFWAKPPTDLSAFGDFMHQIVARYRGRIFSWELWNEPDNAQYWTGTPDQFAEMVERAAAQVRAADPDAQIVLGGMAVGRGPFFDQLMRKDHIGDYVDVINLHGYLETWSPERAEAYPDRIQKMHELVVESAPTKDLWLAEMGYSDYRYSQRETSVWGMAIAYKYEHTPAYQAAQLWRVHLMTLGTGEVSLTTWYRIDDLPTSTEVIGDDNNKHLGVLDVHGKRKPAFYALRLFNHLLGQPVRAIQNQMTVLAKQDSQSVVRAFEREDGSAVVSAWLRSSNPSEVRDASGLAKDHRREKLVLRLPERFTQGNWTLRRYDLHGRVLDAVPLRHGKIGVKLHGPQLFIAEIVRSSESNP